MFLSQILFPVAGIAEFLPDDSPKKRDYLLVRDMFTGLVEYLRQPILFPHPPINRLLTLTWRLVGNQIIHCSIVPGSARLHFCMERKNGQSFGQFMCPEHFAEMAVERPYYTLGSLVWASSLCRDCWQNKFLPFSNVMSRAEMWEAEFLLTCLKHESFHLDKYQKRIIDQFPRGLETGKSRNILYPLRRKYMEAA